MAIIMVGKAINLAEKYTQNYSKEEFEFILSLFSHFKLIEPIKKHPNMFKSEIAGFSMIDKLQDKKIYDIYYRRIYNKGDQGLAQHMELLINNYIKKVDERIIEEIDEVDIVRTKIEKNDIQYFDKLITVLLGTSFKENIPLYFKIIDYKLTPEQKLFIDNELKKKVEFLEIAAEVEKNLTIKFEKQINKKEEEFNSAISEREFHIKLLKEELKENTKKYEVDLKTKNLLVDNMQKEFDNIKNEKSREIQENKRNLNELQSLVDELNRENSEKDEKIEALSNIIDMKINEFNELTNKRWQEENESLLKNREAVNYFINQLKDNKNNLEEEIELLNNKKYLLLSRIELLENRAEDFVNNIRFILDMLSVKKQNINEQFKLYIKHSITIENEPEKNNDKSIFIEDLQMNLESSGIDSEYSFNLSQYIFATFTNKMNLLLVGYNSRKVADAISCLISGSTAEIITLPLGYNDCVELIKTVNSSESRVILIENAVDNISENVYLPLIKQQDDKFIIFSIESSDCINILPKGLLNYMNIIDIETFLGYESNDELLCSFVNKDLFSIDIDIFAKKMNLNYIKDLDRAIRLGNVIKYKIAEIMAIIDKLNSHDSMYDVLMFSLSVLCRQNSKTDELRQFIDKQDFNASMLKRLYSALGDGLAYEL